MAVNAVQENNTCKSPHKPSYIGSIAIGALSGYALKWAIPITPWEKKDEYKTLASTPNRDLWVARDKEIETIKNSKEKLDGVDEFIKLNNDNKLDSSEIKKIQQPLQDKLMALYNRVVEAGIEAKAAGRKKLNIYTKSIRPAGIFILLGVLISLGITLTKTIINSPTKDMPDSDAPN